MFRILQSRRIALYSLLAAVVCIVLSVMTLTYWLTPAYGVSVIPKAGATATMGTTSTVSTTPVTEATGISEFNEPDAGEQVITSAITGAKKSVWLEMYLLTDTNIIQALES